MNQPNNNAPEFVQRIRASIGVSQQALADEIGVTRFSVIRWETGQNKPSPLSLQRLQELIRKYGSK